MTAKSSRDPVVQVQGFAGDSLPEGVIDTLLKVKNIIV